MNRSGTGQGLYKMSNFGRVHPSSNPNNNSFILRLFHEGLHNSFVTLKIDASDISFVKNVASGRIVDAFTTGFKALQGRGTLTVELSNTGELTAEFTVAVIKCTRGVHHIPAKSIILDPGKIMNATFLLRSYSQKGGNMTCEGTVFPYYSCISNLADVPLSVVPPINNISKGGQNQCFIACTCSVLQCYILIVTFSHSSSVW